MFRLIKKIIIIIILLVICVFSYISYKGYKLYENAINNCSIEQMVEKIKGKKNYTILDDMPQLYKSGVVAVEDSRFYKNSYGFDIISIIRAIYYDIKFKQFKEGGSTITQQLAKNTYFTQEKKLSRKIAEILMANEFENALEKDEILELYLNTCFFGHGFNTPSEAAIGYFNTSISELNDYQITMLIGIPNAPSVYNPIDNIDLAKKRHIQVLNKLEEKCIITTNDKNKILNTIEN